MDISQVVYTLGRKEPSGVSLLGTAFAVSNDKVATAYHVVGPSDENLVLVLPRVQSLSDYQDTTDRSLRTIPVSMAAPDPIRDIAVLQLPKTFRMNFTYSLTGSDYAPTGSEVFTLGFPHANFGRLVLTRQNAHVGARVLIENSGRKSKHLILNTQAREGQSGGPVMDTLGGNVLAMVIGSYAPGGGGMISIGGVDPATLHQTTHAISSEYIGDML